MKKKEHLGVHLRGGFSDRNGIKKENTQIQYKDFDERTRVCFVNFINKMYHKTFEFDIAVSKMSFFRKLLSDVYLRIVNYDRDFLYSENKILELIYETIKYNDYDEVLTLIEFLYNEFCNANGRDLSSNFNNLFKKEYVGYRFVGKIIVPITDENEINSINEATNTSFESVNKHMVKAVDLLADRKNPDYENSIKESISAVEAICVSMLSKGATLGTALKQLENRGIVIHPSLKVAFEKLYGYTSDANGIRHAGNIGGTSSTFDEAKFMLVSCSAFINYIIGVSAN